jgi:hypothetical protein
MDERLFILPQAEIAAYGQQALTYGSLTPKGVRTMVATLNRLLEGSGSEISAFDLGCGDGELIWHLQKQLGGHWEGVEISEHRVSLQVRDVCIWQGDFLTESLRPYNLLHADNLCLEDSVAEALEQKIAREFSGVYISYRTPEAFSFLKRARLLETVPTETTWTTHPIQFWQL